MRIPLLLLALTFCSPLNAQSATPDDIVRFDPLSIVEFEGLDPYDIDQAFAEIYNVAVPSPIRLLLPRHEGLRVSRFPAFTDAALIGFSFSALTPVGSNVLEDLQIFQIEVPLFLDSADPDSERRLAAARILDEEAFEYLIYRSEGADIFAIEPFEPIELTNVPGALQVSARYFHKDFDSDRIMRAVILPHPNSSDSYIAFATIQLDDVPATDREMFAATVSGRVLASWEYR